MKIKQVHGPQMTLNRGAIDHPKTILDHKTMFRIKTRTNISGNKIIEIAQILNQSNDNLKIEPNFNDALSGKLNKLEEFFANKMIDAFIYEEEDFQMWKFTDTDQLVDKVGNLPFKDKIFKVLVSK